MKNGTNTTWWSITRAIKGAQSIGLNLSRPTIISLCRQYKVGYQLAGKGGWWRVDSVKFMKLIKGEL